MPTQRALVWTPPVTVSVHGAHVVDGVVPRSTLPQVLSAIAEVGKRYDLPIANVFHAGDGNLHPLILFDGEKPGELERVKERLRSLGYL